MLSSLVLRTTAVLWAAAIPVWGLVGGVSELSGASGANENGLALSCGKLVTMDAEERVFDPGLVLIRDGKIEYVGPPREVPEGFVRLDVGDHWSVPGQVELHSHIQTGSWEDTNSVVLPTNPAFRTGCSVRPSNHQIQLACAGGVTTLFGIAGSGNSMSGFGVLYKAKTASTYEECVLRDPGGLKVAQTHNPERWADLGGTRAGLSWTLEKVNDQAVAALEQGRFDPRLENLVRVHAGELPVLIHCAAGDGVGNTVRMWRIRYQTKSVLSHGSFDGYKLADFVAEHGMPVNHGPRTADFYSTRTGRVVPSALVYYESGGPDFSLNTDSPVVPQEELFLQGSMAARQGAPGYAMLAALTIHPARAFGIEDRVGSLEVGKDADVVVYDGNPLDPRSRVELVLIDGEIQYQRESDGQWF